MSEVEHLSLAELAKKAAPIAQNAHLESVFLRHIKAAFAEAQNQAPERVSIHSEHQVEHAYEPSPDTPKLTVLVHLDLKIRAEDTELYDLKATFAASYSLNRNVPESALANFSAFAETNSIIHIWPYYRELVQSITWRMGLPPFSLPLFRVGTGQRQTKTENFPESDLKLTTSEEQKQAK